MWDELLRSHPHKWENTGYVERIKNIIYWDPPPQKKTEKKPNKKQRTLNIHDES